MFLELKTERKSLYSSQTTKMEMYPGSTLCWILASVLIFASSFQPSGALEFTKTPDKPTIVVEGVNSTDVALVWTILPADNEVVDTMFLSRQRPMNVEAEDIASKKSSNAFSLKPKFQSEYRAELPATLKLLNVDNTEEYVYTLEVTYYLKTDSSAITKQRDRVTVIVRVPPRITVFRERQSIVPVGDNLTLTCNASGDPHPNITWTKEGATAAQFNATTGVLLHLVNVQRKDVGSYNCTADNGYGTPATNLAVVNVKCPPTQCDTKTVGITINDKQNWPWKPAYTNKNSIEYKMLESNITSEVASIYARNPNKQLYQQAVLLFRPGSIVVHLQLIFGKGVADALKPLEDEVKGGRLGSFPVDRTLDLKPTIPPSSTATETTPTGKTGEPSAGARSSDSGLSKAAMWGIIGACIAAVLIVAIVILVICCRKKTKGGASEGKLKYSEADGYRMNRQPPPSGLGTASPAYVEARMYAPANATSRQDDQPPPFNYAELSHDNTSSKPPPPRYSSEYSEVLPEKRPQQGEGGGFELWC